MNKFKSVLLAITSGAVVGGAIADIAVPGVLTWYNIPGGGQALCNCADVVGSTSQSLVHAHLIAEAAGALVFAVGSLFFGARREAGKPPAPPSIPA